MDDLLKTVVVNIIADQSARPPELVQLTDKLSDDLMLDSLDRVELTLHLEAELEIDIDDKHIDRLRTVVDVVKLVREIKMPTPG